MRTLVNGALALGLAGALTMASVDTSEARWRGGKWVAAGAIGLAAGAVIGSALASRSYYGPGYSYGYGYGYAPAYSYGYPAYGYGYPAATYYEPAPTYTYAAPAPTYVAPSYGYAAPAPAYVAAPAVAPGRCWVATDRDKGFGYWGACR
ncbi:MAG: hypothetical protein M5U07_04965 [Xanthobacteraceae bacterium]|nr:hypothetical protein [Xanthobacteraceae bacterium]